MMKTKKITLTTCDKCNIWDSQPADVNIVITCGCLSDVANTQITAVFFLLFELAQMCI